MNKHDTLSRRVLLSSAIGLAVFPFVAGAQSNVAPLTLGDAMPDISGRTPAGNTLDLLAGVHGATAVIVFSFSKAAGKDARLWNDRLFKDYDANHSISVITVIMLESVPRLLRGMILSDLRSDMPARMQNNTIVSYQDEDMWKRRLAAIDDGHAIVLLVGPDGCIRWRESSGFSDVSYKELNNVLRAQSR